MSDEVNPQESYGPTKSKAITEEDVRVSNRLDLDKFFETDVSEEEKNKRIAKMELLLIARFETLRDNMVYLGSAGAFSVQSSELRVMAARAIAALFFDVQTGFAQETKDDNARVERDQKAASKEFAERKAQNDANEGDVEATSNPSLDPSLRTTNPEQEFDFLSRVLGEDVLKESPKVVANTSPARRENVVPATGAKPDGTQIKK